MSINVRPSNVSILPKPSKVCISIIVVIKLLFFGNISKEQRYHKNNQINAKKQKNKQINATIMEAST
jgi:hypothetical protein